MTARKKRQIAAGAPPPEIERKLRRREDLSAELEAAEATAAEARRAVVEARALGTGDVVALSEHAVQADRAVDECRAALALLDGTIIPEAREAAGVARARAEVDQSLNRAAELRDQIAEADDACAEYATGLAERIARVEALRGDYGKLPIVGILLRARFPDLDLPRIPPPPDRLDHLREPLAAASRRHRVAPFVVSHTASATEDEVRRATLRTLKEWLERHGHSLPPAVQEIFAIARVPEPAPTERERERAAAKAEQDARNRQELARFTDEQRALQSIRGGMR